MEDGNYKTLDLMCIEKKAIGERHTSDQQVITRKKKL